MVSARTPAIFAIASVLALAPRGTARAQDVREEVKQQQPKLTRPPVLLEFRPAPYPPQAQKQGIQGKVELILDLDPQGRVARVEVVSAPSDGLAAAAVETVKKFRFSPAEIDGKPAPIRVRYAYNFVLERTFTPRLPDWMIERARVAAKDDVVVGVVREQGTRLPIAGAAVAVRVAGIEVKADGRGRFAIEDLPPGKARLEAIALEFASDVIEVEIREGEQAKVTFYLKRLRADPYETVVRGKRPQTTVTRVTLRRKQMTTVPGTFGDPVRVVENLPGLARVPYVGGALLVRGSAPTDSGVFLDGIRIPLIYHFLGGPSVLNPQFLDRIDYFAGNADVRYGRLLAGVVDVSTRDTFTEQLHGSVDINLLNAAAYLNVPLTSKVSISGALRRSYIDALLPAVLDAAGQQATTVVPVYYDYQLRMDVKLAADDRLSFLAFGSDDDLAVASNEPDQDVSLALSSKISFHRLRGKWDAQLAPRVRQRLQPVFGFDLVNLGAGEASVDVRQWVAGLRDDLEIEVNKRLQLRLGLDVEARRSSFEAEIPLVVDYRNPGTPGGLNPRNFGSQLTGETERVSVSQWLGGVGSYLDAVINATDRLQLIPGLRAGLIFYLGHTRPVLDPRLTVRYRLRPSTTLKGAAGMFSKAPEPGQANKEFGNPKLQLEHAAQFSVGVEHQITDALNIDAQLYWNQRYDLAIRTEQVRFVDGVPTRLSYVNDGEGYSAGLELLIKHEVTRNFYGWLAYTLSRSARRRRGGGDIVRFTFDQTHLLTLVASYRLPHGWEAGIRFRLASGRPETPVLGGIFDSDGDRYAQIFGEELSLSRPLFHQLDVRIEKTWLFDLWRLAVYLDVLNVYNAKNPEATLFDYRFRKSGPLRGLPFLPTFGVKGSF